MSRTLVVYFSRSGHTQNVAQRVASAVGADVDPIVDRTRRSGLLGYLRSGYEALVDRDIAIAPPTYGPASYDLVVIGTPIWNMSVSSPVRSYLRRHRDELRAVAFFCTLGGSGAERVFARMEQLCGKLPVATLALRENEMDHAGPAIEQFVSRLRASGFPEKPAPPPPIPTPMP